MPFHLSITHLLETYYILRDCGNVQIHSRWQIRWCTSVATERARNLVESVNLGENPSDVIVENAVVINARVIARPPQMLNPQSNRCERVLDLVSDLARHFAPGQDAFGARYFDPAELQISRQPLRRDPAQP